MTTTDSVDENRVIVHLDVDAFYVACERELRPDLKNCPLAVSQYNPYGNLADRGINDPARILYNGQKSNATENPDVNGSLIAVSYEARARNVKRNDRGLEAIRKCPELVIVQVPVLHGKANLSIYRDASERLMSTLLESMKKASRDLYEQLSGQSFPSFGKSIPLEKASVDEVYLDISLPVQKILQLCAEQTCWEKLFQALTEDESASSHTTIGGLETRQSALATNSLSKDDIRRGSSLQVLDSEGAANTENEAEKAWWSRDFPDQWGEDEIALAIGSLITLNARQSILSSFDGTFTLSAGVSLNKIMSKLASGLKKPNRQTLINPNDEATLQKLFHPLPLGRIRGLGGKLGCHVEEVLQVKTVGELKKVPLATLESKFGQKQAQFLFQTAQGICKEEVQERTKPKCIGAGKTFQGPLSISSTDHNKLRTWLRNLASDIHERVIADKTRYPKTLVCWLNMTTSQSTNGKEKRRASLSASIPPNASVDKYTKVAFQLATDVIKSAGARKGSFLIVGMSVTATNFVSIAQGSNSIMSAFQRSSNSDTTPPRNAIEKDLKPVVKGTSSQRPLSMLDFLQRSASPEQETILTTETLASNDRTTERKPIRQLNSPDKSSSYRQDRHSQLSTDFEQAQALQRQFDEEMDMAPETEISTTSEGNDDRTTDFTDDPDLRYAKQLQASFDRENETIATMEKRRSIAGCKTDGGQFKRGGKKRKVGQQACRPISSFFGLN